MRRHIFFNVLIGIMVISLYRVIQDQSPIQALGLELVE